MDDRLPGIRPRPSWGRRLDMAARRGFPLVVTVLLVLVFGHALNIYADFPRLGQFLMSITRLNPPASAGQL